MKLVIRQLDWYKRRPDPKDPKPISVSVPDLQLIEGHCCDMLVNYSDGQTFNLTGRVYQNDITKAWAVHGIDHQGHACLADIDLSV